MMGRTSNSKSEAYAAYCCDDLRDPDRLLLGEVTAMCKIYGGALFQSWLIGALVYLRLDCRVLKGNTGTERCACIPITSSEILRSALF